MDEVDRKTNPQEPEGGTKESISRRDALKRMAKIALGIGAISVLPAALNGCFYEDYYDYYDYYSDYYYNYYSEYYYHYDYYNYYSEYYY